MADTGDGTGARYQSAIDRGIANARLPLAQDGANIVVFDSGWGDGHYPMIGGFDADGALIAVHLDFLVTPEPEGNAGSAPDGSW